MDLTMEELKRRLAKCRSLLRKGYMSTEESGLEWLNGFCAEFHAYCHNFHKLMHAISKENMENEFETAFLCVTQVVTCVKQMERTLEVEKSGGMAISSSRQYFLDRINFCLERLRNTMTEWQESMATSSLNKSKSKLLEEQNFVELIDMVLDELLPYCQDHDGEQVEDNENSENVAEDRAEAMFSSTRIRSIVDIILGHTLGFANVALDMDKRALSALCQKVLRECMAFQQDCSLGGNTPVSVNHSNRKLKADSLKSAIYQLEDYISEALLRLVFRCFVDFENLSIERLRTAIQQSSCSGNAEDGGHVDDPLLDDLIAAFDVNMDRAMQIGVFAIAFAPNFKVKTAVRTALASFESLEMYLIPSLYKKASATDVFSEILEQHFNEELSSYKVVIQEVIDSYAFAACYHEQLSQCLQQVEKEFTKGKFEESIAMAQLLDEHFQLKVNYEDVKKKGIDCMESLKKFRLIVHECQAVLMCAKQVEPQRILKRFKILRSMLRNFLDTLGEKSSDGVAKEGNPVQTDNVFEIASLDSQEFAIASQEIFKTAGIAPSTQSSILYSVRETPMRRRCVSDSLKGNYSKLALTSPIVQPLAADSASHTKSPLSAEFSPSPESSQSAEFSPSPESSQSAEFSPSPESPQSAEFSPSPESLHSAESSPSPESSQSPEFSLSAEFQQSAESSPHTSQHGQPQRVNSVRRMPSLRTTMFKRQKSLASQQIYNAYKSQSASLQISEILDNLTSISNNLLNISVDGRLSQNRNS